MRATNRTTATENIPRGRPIERRRLRIFHAGDQVYESGRVHGRALAATGNRATVRTYGAHKELVGELNS
eukprot:4761771-Pyramimonas_sp.AAC.2